MTGVLKYCPWYRQRRYVYLIFHLPNENDEPIASRIARGVATLLNKLDLNVAWEISGTYLTELRTFGFACGPKLLFNPWHRWFESHGVFSPSKAINVYIVNTLGSKRGCALPRTQYVLLRHDASSKTLFHELGHHADLMHRRNPSNLMNPRRRTSPWILTGYQRRMFQSAHFLM
tara:strand:+ start:1219 stop:1740 length:522 start_codon:yes stop_codon:yes gene_type:complete